MGYLVSAGVDWGQEVEVGARGQPVWGLGWKGRVRSAVFWCLEGGVLLEGRACNEHNAGLTLKIIKKTEVDRV